MGDDCINPIESSYKCKGGFNLSIFNLSCPNANSQENISSMQTCPQTDSGLVILAIAVVGVSLVLLFFTIIVIISLLIFIIYLVRKSKNTTGILSAKDSETQIKQKSLNNESIYNSIDELPQADNSKNTATFEASPMLGEYHNLAKPQCYPGKLQDENADYQTL
ncbi:hypothetical protein LOD99_8470 [Oopsacas minuta]|uniref:Uncharacterized protein n=1 Tax=Oopsacas minuta TaxID=111878 RepID=A0AAV7JGF5_9METZ|nr:hypothetical protein LOD99_8470 [Oopsacas minuta]